MKKIYRNIAILLVLTSVFVVAYGCSSNNEANGSNETNDVNETNESNESSDVVQPETDKKPIVTMTMEDGGEIQIELYPNTAPNTVNNFISLIEDGFYDGLTFHRVIPEFMIQGGDPEGNGTGGPDYSIKGEFSSNGVDNELKHEPGVISMARSQDPDSAGSQFFIVTGDATHLDGDYAGFGKVTSGMEVVKEIEGVERDQNDKPTEDQVIESMTVDLDGYEAQKPIKE